MAIKMGMNAIRCEGLYADVKESGFGKGLKSASDFNTTDIVTATGMMALLAFASGCMSLVNKDEVTRELVKNGDFGRNVDAELKATKVGDSITYDKSIDGSATYNVMFKGIGPDGKANFDILHRNNELKHLAVGNYEKPATYEKMLDMTDRIMAGQSTDSMALLKFEGTGRWEMLAYAYINGSEADLKLVEVFR